ncbi:hypothetical protein Leryth_011219, partial [Lithospermum erythrorhizon]
MASLPKTGKFDSLLFRFANCSLNSSTPSQISHNYIAMGFTGCVKRPIGYTTKADKGASFFESRQNKTGFCIIRDSVFGVPS